MDSRGEVSLTAVIGTVVSIVIAAVVGLIGLRILSPFAARCDDSGVFVEVCTDLSLSLGSAIAGLVGPLGLVMMLISLLIFAFSRG